jgi:hypothetical protein
MEILKTAFWIAIALLALDVIGFLAWALSGQHPTDGYFLGTITWHLIKLF